MLIVKMNLKVGHVGGKTMNMTMETTQTKWMNLLEVQNTNTSLNK